MHNLASQVSSASVKFSTNSHERNNVRYVALFSTLSINRGGEILWNILLYIVKCLHDMASF